MTKIAIRVLTLAMLSTALVSGPVLKAFAAGGDTPSAPPASDTKASDTKHKKKGDKSSSIDDPKFLEDVADVANLIGYSYRKLGNYELSQAYYQRALKDDPNHVRTWQYYGLWQLEQGNREQAQYHLSKIGELAGTDSKEYRSLQAALETPPGTGLVY